MNWLEDTTLTKYGYGKPIKNWISLLLMGLVIYLTIQTI